MFVCLPASRVRLGYYEQIVEHIPTNCSNRRLFSNTPFLLNSPPPPPPRPPMDLSELHVVQCQVQSMDSDIDVEM